MMIRFFLKMAMLLLCCGFSQPLLAAQKILVLGDSLSAAYGMAASQGWPALLQQQLDSKKYQLVNASVSGETTRGGLQRLKPLLAQHRPSIVILELGANDGLRGLATAEMRRNLEQMIQLSQQHGAQVLLIGMKIPPNYGPQYSRQFEQVFADLAKQYRLPWLPFLLDGLNESDFQADQLHPTSAAQPRLMRQVLAVLSKMLS